MSDQPGLTPVPAREAPPQITDVKVASGAMRSRSKGWLPCVVLTVITEDGAGITGCFPADEQLVGIATHIVEAGVRATEDVAAALRAGTIR